MALIYSTDQEGVQVHAVLRLGGRDSNRPASSPAQKSAEVRDQGWQTSATAEARAKQLREHFGFPNAGVYNPALVGGTYATSSSTTSRSRNGTGGLPANPDYLT